MRISRSLLNRLALAHPGARRSPAQGTPLLLLVTVEEGPGIRDMNGSWEDGPLTDLLPQLLTELGWKVVEHAVRRTLVLRIGRAAGESGNLTCDADRGGAFEAVEIYDAKAPGAAGDPTKSEARHV